MKWELDIVYPSSSLSLDHKSCLEGRLYSLASIHYSSTCVFRVYFNQIDCCFAFKLIKGHTKSPTAAFWSHHFQWKTKECKTKRSVGCREGVCVRLYIVFMLVQCIWSVISIDLYWSRLGCIDQKQKELISFPWNYIMKMSLMSKIVTENLLQITFF